MFPIIRYRHVCLLIWRLLNLLNRFGLLFKDRCFDFHQCIAMYSLSIICTCAQRHLPQNVWIYLTQHFPIVSTIVCHDKHWNRRRCRRMNGWQFGWIITAVSSVGTVKWWVTNGFLNVHFAFYWRKFVRTDVTSQSSRWRRKHVQNSKRSQMKLKVGMGPTKREPFSRKTLSHLAWALQIILFRVPFYRVVCFMDFFRSVPFLTLDLNIFAWFEIEICLIIQQG